MTRCLSSIAQVRLVGFVGLVGLVVLLALPAGARANTDLEPRVPPLDGAGFLDLVRADVTAGRLTAEEALLLRFQYGFAADELPARYKVDGFSPLRCATDLITTYYQQRDRLTKDTVDRIDGWLQPEAGKTVHLSPTGRFAISYSLTGPDAVSAADAAPADGVPDFVANVADWLEASWAVQVDTLGLPEPPLPGGAYDVSFESMQYYGYTAVVDAGVGSTRIVLHNTYAGFPANDDPAGSAVGAAKVTAAHEFRHACQYVVSRWSEAGWIELDATWSEDVVFDEVNDYVNYLSGESPVRRPDLPLDGGSFTTGSYEDCIWQTWLAETRGTAIIREFWARRGAVGGEPVMETYRAVLNAHGTDLATAWASFTAWNVGVGGRSVPGVGYREGATYPAGPVFETVTTYPATVVGATDRLAAAAIRCEGFAPDGNDRLRIRLVGDPVAGPFSLAVHLALRDGAGQVVSIPVGATGDADQLLAVPARDILAAHVVVGLAATSGLPGAWTVDLALETLPALPAVGLESGPVACTLTADGTAQATVQLANTGEAGSLLAWSAQVWTTDPAAGKTLGGRMTMDLSPMNLSPTNLALKSVAGSQVSSSRTGYLPGALMNLPVAVHNASLDDEWLTDVTLSLPAGVTALVASDLIGGSLGDLVWDGTLGAGVTVRWHGTYGTQQYGVVRAGESAFGTVQVLVAPEFSGDLVLGWTVTGDNYGGAPHQVSGALVLAEEDPVLALNLPAPGATVAIGEAVAVTWSTGGVVAAVDLDLSRDGGETWQPVATGLPNTGAAEIELPGPPANTCRLRVRAADGSASDAGAGDFFLYQAPAWLTVTPPAGVLGAGATAAITLDLDAGGLAPGAYPAWLVITAAGGTPPTGLPVQLQVTPAGSDVPATGPVFALHPAVPNPFNPRTRIAFDLPAAATATVDVLDVRGRLVRRLVNRFLAAGPHRVVWDGCDAVGHPLGAGVYLVRVQGGGDVATRKVLLAK